MILEFIAKLDWIPPRLDKFILENNKNLSRSIVLKLIKNEQVQINNSIQKKASFRLKKNCFIRFEIPKLKTTTQILPQDLKIKTVLETVDYYIFDKPAGIIVHPTSKIFSNTLVNFILYKNPNINQVLQDNIRPGIVHRLDRDTSWLIIVAKNLSSLHYFQNLFKQRKITKKYLGLAQGKITPTNGTIDSPITKGHTIGKQILDSHGKKSVTHYTVLEYLHDFSFLKLKIDTGRTHQIRVHLDAIHHSIVGDNLYGKTNSQTKKLLENTKLTRQFLHAHSLEFICPTTNKLIKVISPLSDDLEKTIQFLKNN